MHLCKSFLRASMEQHPFNHNSYEKKSEDKHLRTNWLYKNCFEFSEFELLRGNTRTEFSVLHLSSKEKPLSTIQDLPQVYKLSIGAVSGLSWASGRLIVQVLDDSTNEVLRVAFPTPQYTLI